jgi:hypothetical protein
MYYENHTKHTSTRTFCGHKTEFSCGHDLGSLLKGFGLDDKIYCTYTLNS